MIIFLAATCYVMYRSLVMLQSKEVATSTNTQLTETILLKLLFLMDFQLKDSGINPGGNIWNSVSSVQVVKTPSDWSIKLSKSQNFTRNMTRNCPANIQIQQQKYQKKFRNMFKVNNKNYKNNVNDVLLVFLLLTLNVFHTFFSVSIVDFKQVNVNWVTKDFFSILTVKSSTFKTN